MLGERFAASILEAIVGSLTLDDLGVAPALSVASPLGADSRLIRRSDEDIAVVVNRIVSVVSRHPDGIMAETLRREIGLSKRELFTPMKLAVATRVIRKTGKKRATYYFPTTESKIRAAKRSSRPKSKRPTEGELAISFGDT